MEDKFLISLREENAKSIGVAVHQMDERDIHEIEERLKIEVGEVKQPMGSTGGYLMGSPMYGVENEKEREERKKRVERKFFSEKSRW